MKNKLAFLMIVTALSLTSALRADSLLRRACDKVRECGSARPKQKCETSGKKCAPVVTTQIIEKRDYSTMCEPFCQPRSSVLASACGKKNECDSSRATCEETCGKVRTRKLLVVTIRKQEHCVKSCEVMDCPGLPRSDVCAGTQLRLTPQGRYR